MEGWKIGRDPSHPSIHKACQVWIAGKETEFLAKTRFLLPRRCGRITSHTLGTTTAQSPRRQDSLTECSLELAKEQAGSSEMMTLLTTQVSFSLRF